jgi:sialate O-acetylesterase
MLRLPSFVIRHWALVITSLWLVAPARADFTLPGIFADRMVLQRDLPAAVFGSGDPGETLTVTLKDAAGATLQTKTAQVAPDQRWRLLLDPTPAGGPFTLTIADATTSRTLRDVLFGEVWLMSGQSNMANPVGKTDYAPLVEGDNFPLIRAYLQRTGWAKAETFNIQFMYAQAYFFARAVHRAEDQKVPVGFYSAAFVNSSIHEWMDPLTLAAHPESAAKPEAGRHFNSYVLPALGYTFRGLIWDQGENNAGLEARTEVYGRWLRDLIVHWRSLSGNPRLHVIVTQLPTIRDQWRSAQTGPVATGGADRTTRIRQAQLDALALPGVYLVTTWDTSDGDIHPRNALPKGERAALIYQNRIMGRTAVAYQGPTFLRQEIKGSQLILHFAHTGSGLALDPKIPATLQADANPATDLLGMAIAGADGKFHWASGILGKDTLTLSSPEVPAPTQARYTWADDLRQLGNLVNSAGLPTPTFRSDPTVFPWQPGAPVPPAPALPAYTPPADGIYEAERTDLRSFSQAGGLDHKLRLSGGVYLSTNGKTFTTEWTRVHAPAAGPQPLALRYRSRGATVTLLVNGVEISSPIALPDTDGKFATLALPAVPLRAGSFNRIKLASAPDNAHGADLDALAVGNPAAFTTLDTPIP